MTLAPASGGRTAHVDTLLERAGRTYAALM